MDTAVVQLSLDELMTGAEITPQGSIQAPIQTSDAESIFAEIPPEIVARLENLAADEVRYLLGPVVYHPGWLDAGQILPKYIPQARLELVLSGEKSLATLEEALTYLASASLCFPLHGDDAEVMFWLIQEVWGKHKLIGDDQPVWEMLGHEGPFTLTHYLEHEVLNSLRRNIRSSVVRHSTVWPAKKRHGGFRDQNGSRQLTG